MFRQFLLWLWSMRAQFLRYFITGGSGVILDLVSIFFLKEYLHIRPVIAVVINQIFILSYIFLLNKYWSFQAGGFTRQQLPRFMLLAAGNYMFAIAWMWTLTENFHVYYILARVMNIALSACWNFLLYRYFVYAPPRVLAEVVCDERGEE
jgi:putative flippase GtrA